MSSKKFEMLDKHHGWATCCNRSKSKDSPKDGCPPDLYEGSEECINTCFGEGKLKKLKPMFLLSTIDQDTGEPNIMSETYPNDTCNKILTAAKYNDYSTKLGNFCSNPPAYNLDKKIIDRPEPAYAKICGCHYPTDYYTAVKTTLLKKYPGLAPSLGDLGCFSDLCKNSTIKRHTNQAPTPCPDSYLQYCIANQNIDYNKLITTDSTINQENIAKCVQDIHQKSEKEGGIHIDIQDNKSPPPPPPSPPPPSSSPPSPSPSSSEDDNNLYEIILVVIGIIGILALIAFAIYRR